MKHHLKTRKQKQRGGQLTRNIALKHIVSVGYEIESGIVLPFVPSDPDDPDDVLALKPIGIQYAKDASILIHRTDDESFVLTPESLTQNTISMKLDAFFDKHTKDDISITKDGAELFYLGFKTAPDFFDCAEFHYTFKRVAPSENIILTTLQTVVHALHDMFTGVVTVNNCRIQTLSSREVWNICTVFNALGVYYVIPGSNISATDVNWTFQLTFGVHLEHVVEVVNHIAKDTAIERLDIVNRLLGLWTRTWRFNPTVKGFLFVLLLNICPSDISKKTTYHFSLRHTIREIFESLSADDRSRIDEFARTFDADDKAIPTYGSVRKLLDLRNVEYVDDPIKKTGTRRFVFADGVVLFEVRNFNKQLQKLIGSKQTNLSTLLPIIDGLA
jgi:hypothetical protein